MHKTLIIAEAGINHNGNLGHALELVDIAARSGADIIKFQTFVTKKLVTKFASKAPYQLTKHDQGATQYEMLLNCELSPKDHSEIMRYCEKCNIGFLSTAFDKASVDLLVQLGAAMFKVPSGELTNTPLLRHIGQYGHPILLSTGMSDLTGIDAALSTLEQVGTPISKVTVLHCNTDYPTLMDDVNLNAMQTISQKFGVQVGYSDHTLGIEIPIAAVALGATVIEKHFTLDRQMSGPDHNFSLTEHEFRAMVEAIRNIELAMGDGVKRVSASARKNMIAAQKSIVAAVTIRQGDVFTNANLTTKRPGNGMSPTNWDRVIGQVAERDFDVDDIIELCSEKLLS